MHFILPTLAALGAATLVCFLVRARGKPVLVVILGVGLCLVLVSLMIIPGGTMIAQKGNSVGAFNNRNVPDTVVKEDRKFLNDLIQQQDQNKPAPRAELVVNTSEVRRAQLVVNGRVVERGETVRPR
jgi:phosphoribosylformylglycinamidine (FGAM) synthase-like amidotransferase family enzyme